MHPAVIEPRRRLGRAWDHFQALDRAIGEYFDRRPHLIVRHEDPDSGDEFWTAFAREAIPDSIPLLIGDCLHNLRAALENLAWNFALTRNTKPPEDTAFVICISAEQFQGKSGRLRGIPKAPRDIIKELQPYKRTPNDPKADPLWVLERLWNDDKHRTPHIVSGILGQSALHIIEISGVAGFTPTVKHGPFKDGDKIAQLEVEGRTPESKVNVEAQFAFGIAFDQASPARGAYIDHTLGGLYHYIRDEVFGRFEDVPIEDGS